MRLERKKLHFIRKHSNIVKKCSRMFFQAVDEMKLSKKDNREKEGHKEELGRMRGRKKELGRRRGRKKN